MTEKVTEEMEPGSTGRGAEIVLARETNDGRLYPAEAEKTTSSFHMTDCSTIHSLFSSYILKERKMKT
jgi:hypothetical protein